MHPASVTAAKQSSHDRAWRQVGLGLFLDCLRREATNQVELQMHGMPVFVDRNGCHDRNLVLGTMTGLATCARATKIGVIEMAHAAQLMGAVLSGHLAVELLVRQLGSRVAVAHAHFAHERQRRQPGLGLADQVGGEETGSQQQFGVLHQTARGQRGLVPAIGSGEELAGAMADDIRHSENTEAAQKISDLYTVLKQNLVEGQGLRFAVREIHIMKRKIHGMSLP